MSMFGLEAMPLKRAVAPGTAIVRVLPTPLYDTEVIASAAAISQLLFFAKPQGQADASGVITSKTDSETNMKQAGTLPRPQEFDVLGFYLKLSAQTSGTPLTEADFDLIYSTGCFQFLMGERVFLKVPLNEIGSGVIKYGFTTKNAAVILSNGLPSRSNVYKMSLGKLVPHVTFTESFQVKLTWTSTVQPSANVRVQCIMPGLLYNAL